MRRFQSGILESLQGHGAATAVQSRRDEVNKKRAWLLFFVEAALYFEPRRLSSQESSNNNNRTFRPFLRNRFLQAQAETSIEVFVMNTAWEKFQSATLSLARSGAIKDRLTDAYRNYLALVAEDELPKELREDFRAFGRALTRERPLLRGEDAFRATIRKMSNDEADRIAASVVLLFAAIPRSHTPAMRLSSSAQIVYLPEVAQA